ncbi:MAG: reverse transcriptase [marine bacterium B5-7]|nr:MAG: reverse transcriptase [marine bacterium B5-7]
MSSKDLAPRVGSISNIARVSSLARILGTTDDRLLYIAGNIDKYWKPGKKLPKSDGSIRITNDANDVLKNIHERINRNLLKPCFYPRYLNGSLPGRSIRKNAEFHLRSMVLVNEDIENFYPSARFRQIKGIWKYFFKCSDEVAVILTKLTTYKGSLPQGWKPSSYLANLLFWDTEYILVEKLQAAGFSYSRLMDDITVSSRKPYTPEKLSVLISDLNLFLHSKEFKLKRSKHSIKPSYTRQTVNNQIVNGSKVTVPRERRKLIRALVHSLEIDYSYGAVFSDKYKTKWKSASQRVGGLKHGHLSERNSLRQRLQNIKPRIRF